MGKGGLTDLSWECCLLGAPIAEGGTKAVHGEVKALPPQEHGEHHVRKRLLPVASEDQGRLHRPLGAVASRSQLQPRIKVFGVPWPPSCGPKG